jgi:hypothetical protein
MSVEARFSSDVELDLARREPMREPPASLSRVSWLAVFLEQLSTSWLSLTRELIWGSTVALVIVVASLLNDGTVMVQPTTGPYANLMRFNFVQVASLFSLLIGFFAPMAVWRDAQVNRRAYFWTLPRGRLRHSLMRVVCGWICLLPLILIAVVWWGIITSGRLYGLIGFDGSYWLWLVPVGLGTIGYLWGTALTLASNNPSKAYGLFVLVLLAFVGTTEIRGLKFLEALDLFTLNTITDSTYGWNVLATGHSRPWVEIASGTSIRTLSPNPEPLAWGLAFATWGLLVTLAVVIAAGRYRDS